MNSRVGEVEINKVYDRPWGRYIVLELGEGYLVKRIEVDAGKRFSLQHHNRRTENWIVVSGDFKVTLDDKIINMFPGDSVIIQIGQKHRAECISETTGVFIEVQRGDYLGEDDIVRYEDDFGRISNS